MVESKEEHFEETVIKMRA